MAKVKPVEVQAEVPESSVGTSDDKRPLQSKKFVGFIIFHLSMMGLAAGILAWAWNLDEVSARVFFLLLSIIVVSGFVATGFILGVASLDKYLGLAKIAADGATTGRTNGSLNRVLGKGTKGMIKVDPEVDVPESEPELGEGDPPEEEEEDLVDPDEDVDKSEDLEDSKA